MSTEPTQHSYLELVDEVTAWLVGGGIVTVALFPLALPIIALTAVAVIPLLLIALAVGLVAAVVAAPILLLQRVGRRVRASRRFERVPDPGAAGAGGALARAAGGGRRHRSGLRLCRRLGQ